MPRAASAETTLYTAKLFNDSVAVAVAQGVAGMLNHGRVPGVDQGRAIGLKGSGYRRFGVRLAVTGRGEPPRLLSQDEFEGVLDYYCGDCHALSLAPRCTAATCVLFATAEDLIEIGKLIPGDAAMSRRVRRLWAGEMPPVHYGKSVPTATIELIADFVDDLPPSTLLEE